MPPLGPRRSDDGPACRVCGCTQHNACVVQLQHHPQCGFDGTDGQCNCEAGRVGSIGCSWYETVPGDAPRWLCTACAGTEEDMAEVISRGLTLLLKNRSVKAADDVVAMGQAALERRNKRREGG